MKLPKGFGGQGFTGMLAKAQNAMAQARELDELLASERLVVDKGPVKMIFTGLGDPIELKIDPTIVDPEDVEGLESTILAAIKFGFEETKTRREERVQAIMSDMPKIPGF